MAMKFRSKALTQKAIDEAVQFCQADSLALARELLEARKTKRIVAGGRLEQLISICKAFRPNDAAEFAEFMAINEVLKAHLEFKRAEK